MADGFEHRADRLVQKLGRDQVSKEFILGIRPEHLEISLVKRAEYFPTSCDFVEPMGNRQILHLKIGQQAIKAKTTGMIRASKGKPVWIRFPDEEIRVFDADSYELVI